MESLVARALVVLDDKVSVDMGRTNMCVGLQLSRAPELQSFG